MMRRGLLGVAVLGVIAAGVVALSQAATASSPPGMTEAQILRLALHEAAHSGDRRPTLIQHSEGSHGKANQLTSGAYFGGSARSYLIAERGKFVGYGASVPYGASLPHGTVVTIIVNAATGRVTDGGISYRYPTLAQLGPVTTDFRSYSSCPASGRQQLTSIAAGSSGQLVPGAPAQVLLCRYSGLNPTPSAAGHLLVQRLVRSSDMVKRLTQELDSLGPFQSGSYSCPADFGVKIVAIFRYADDRSDDPVTVDPSGCASATNGHLIRAAASPPGPELIGQLEGLTAGG